MYPVCPPDCSTMDDGTHMPWHMSSSNRIYVASSSWVVHGRVYPACLYHALRLIVKIRAQPTPEAVSIEEYRVKMAHMVKSRQLRDKYDQIINA